MDRPVRFLLVLSAVHFGRSAAVAQEVAPAVEPAENAAAPKRERAISPRIAAMLAAAAPKYDAPKPAESKPAAAARDKPAKGITRLPDYIVREPKLPTPGQVMTRNALEHYAMKKHLGPENGFDRGFLNLFTLAQLWRKIPLIGQYLPAPFLSITNEERAMMFYHEDERLRKMNDLLDLAAMAGKPGVAPADGKLKREIDKTFMRDQGLGRQWVPRAEPGVVSLKCPCRRKTHTTMTRSCNSSVSIFSAAVGMRILMRSVQFSLLESFARVIRRAQLQV